MTELDRKVSSQSEKTNNMQNPELQSGAFTDRELGHSPLQRLLSFPLASID